MSTSPSSTKAVSKATASSAPPQSIANSLVPRRKQRQPNAIVDAEGKRSGVHFRIDKVGVRPEDGLEDEDDLFRAAADAATKAKKNSNQDKSKVTSTPEAAKSREQQRKQEEIGKNKNKVDIRRIRFSLGSTVASLDVGDIHVGSALQKMVARQGKGVPYSPSDLSSVATASASAVLETSTTPSPPKSVASAVSGLSILNDKTPESPQKEKDDFSNVEEIEDVAFLTQQDDRGSQKKSAPALEEVVQKQQPSFVDGSDESSFDQYGDDDLVPPSPPSSVGPDEIEHDIDDKNTDEIEGVTLFKESNKSEPDEDQEKSPHDLVNRDDGFEVANDQIESTNVDDKEDYDDDKEGPGFQLADSEADSVDEKEHDSVEEKEHNSEGQESTPDILTPDISRKKARTNNPVVQSEDEEREKRTGDDESEVEEETDEVVKPQSKTKKRKRHKKEKIDDAKTENKEDTLREKVKKKKGKRKLNATDSDEEIVTKLKSKPKKSKRPAILFSPKGLLAGPREFTTIPVTDLKEPLSKEVKARGLRRSKRARVAPLAFWKNERVIYGPNDFDEEKYDSITNMPVPKAISKAEPTPYKPRKHHDRPVTILAERGKKRHKVENEIEDDTPFDSSRLRKKHKILDTSEARLWDDMIDGHQELKVIAYQKELKGRYLPRSESRPKSESKVVGLAAQAFNVSSENASYPGYIMGYLILPPRGIKDPESVGSCAQTFTVVRNQAQSLEIAYGDPDDEDGSMNPETAQRFLVSSGDMFRIPPGNCYRLQNHSKDTECYLTWTIIRPRQLPDDDDESD